MLVVLLGNVRMVHGYGSRDDRFVTANINYNRLLNKNCGRGVNG